MIGQAGTGTRALLRDFRRAPAEASRRPRNDNGCTRRAVPMTSTYFVRMATRAPSSSVSGGYNTTVCPSDSPPRICASRVVALAQLDRLQPHAPVARRRTPPIPRRAGTGSDRHLQHFVSRQITTRTSTRYASPSALRRPAVPTKSMRTLTRCSSTPSADTFMNPEGSTRRTRPFSGSPPPHCSIEHGRAWRTAHRIGRQEVGHDLQLRGSPISSIGSPAGTTVSLSRSRLRMTPSTGATTSTWRRPPLDGRAAGACQLQLVLRSRDTLNSAARSASSAVSHRRLGGFQLVGRDRAGLHQLLLTARVSCGRAPSCGRARLRSACAWPTAARAASTPASSSPARARIEQRRCGRRQPGHDRPAAYVRDRPARARCAARRPSHRRRDDESIAHARFAVFVERDPHRPPRRPADVDFDRSGHIATATNGQRRRHDAQSEAYVFSNYA